MIENSCLQNIDIDDLLGVVQRAQSDMLMFINKFRTLNNIDSRFYKNNFLLGEKNNKWEEFIKIGPNELQNTKSLQNEQLSKLLKNTNKNKKIYANISNTSCVLYPRRLECSVRIPYFKESIIGSNDNVSRLTPIFEKLEPEVTSIETKEPQTFVKDYKIVQCNDIFSITNDSNTRRYNKKILNTTDVSPTINLGNTKTILFRTADTKKLYNVQSQSKINTAIKEVSNIENFKRELQKKKPKATKGNLMDPNKIKSSSTTNQKPVRRYRKRGFPLSRKKITKILSEPDDSDEDSDIQDIFFKMA